MKQKSIVFITMVYVSLLYVYTADPGEKLMDHETNPHLVSKDKANDIPEGIKFNHNGIKKCINYEKMDPCYINIGIQVNEGATSVVPIRGKNEKNYNSYYGIFIVFYFLGFCIRCHIPG